MPKRRAIALAVGVGVGVGAALAVALALWWSAGEPSDAARARPLDGGEGHERVPARLEEPAGDAARVEPHVGEAPATRRVAVAAAVRRDGLVRLTGSVVARDPDGALFANESGHFELIHDRRDGRQRVAVVEGRWEAVVPADARLFVRSVRLDDRPCDIGWFLDNARVPASGVLAVEVQWTPVVRLRVRSARDGRELDSCTVYVPGSYATCDEYPRRVERERCSAHSSPMSLFFPRELFPSRRAPVLVRAPGHAWRCVDIDVYSGTERVVELQPGGTLEVLAVGETSGEYVVVRVRDAERHDAEPYAERELDGGSAVFEGMAVGRYDVRVEVGSSGSPLVLGRGVVDVVAGERASLALALEPLPPPRAGVPLCGTLVGAFDDRSAWARESMFPMLQIRIVGTARRPHRAHYGFEAHDLTRVDAALAWRIKSVQPGRYWIWTNEPPAGVLVDVGATGREDVVLSIPALAQVVVNVVDSRTGRAVGRPDLEWYVEGPEGLATEPLRVEPDDDGRYVFQAPLGAIALGVAEGNFASARLRMQVRPGTNEATLEVRRTCGFALLLRDGASTVPVPSSWRPDAREIGGQGRSTEICWNGITVSHPGLYRFDPPPIDGYEPLPEQHVLVQPGAYTEHVIELVRIP